jgi:hypothetical protein
MKALYRKRLSDLTAIAGLCALLSVPTVTQADIEKTITKTLDAESGGKLVMEVDRGSIEVTGDDAQAVQVKVTRKVDTSSRSRADTVLDAHRVEFKTEGETIHIRARFTKKLPSGWLRRSPNLQVHYAVVVPHEFDIDLRTSGGSVRVQETEGDVNCHTSGGSINVERIDGPVQGRTSGGSIRVSRVDGPVDAQTSGGNIRLLDIQGDVAAVTSGGSIEVKAARGAANLKTSGGNIRASGIRSRILAKTSGGSVTANFAESPPADCHLETSGGTVTVTLPENAKVDLDARSSGGRVVSQLPVSTVVVGEQKRNALQGKVNGGGPTLTTRTTGGGIYIKKN